MGGRSRSSQSTSNQQQTTNIVNDGEFAGASNVTVDESETRIELDSSREYDDSFNTDNSTETRIEDAFNVDKSVTTEVKQDIDNSQRFEYDGEYAGNSGTINITDGGAFDLAEKVTEKSIEGANTALTTALTSNRFIVESLFDEVTDQNNQFVTSLEKLADQSFATNKDVLEDAALAGTKDKELIAELARNTALNGQDIVAKSSSQMIMYLSIAMGVSAVAFVVYGRRK